MSRRPAIITQADVAAKPRLRQWVYFALCDDLVKIGVSRRPKARVKSLGTGNAMGIKFLGCRPGGPDLERKLHHQFRRLHVRGEWFVYGAPIQQYLAGVETVPPEDFDKPEREIIL